MKNVVWTTVSILRAAVGAFVFRRIAIPAVYGPEIIVLVILDLAGLACFGIARAGDFGITFSAQGVSAYLAVLALQTGLLLLAGTRKRGIDLSTLVAILLGIDAVALIVLVLATLMGHRALAALSMPIEAQLFILGGASMIWFLWQAIAVWLLALRSTMVNRRRFAGSIVLASFAPAFILPSSPILKEQASGWSFGLLQSGFDLVKTKRAAQPQPRFKPLNAEAIFARQGALIDTQLDALTPSRPGVSQLYFVGMAPYAGQDVFKREISSAHAIMNDRFATNGHSVVMVNHRDTLSTLPLATAFNLERVLWRIAQVMDRDNDVLMLYITSHGAEGLLSVEMAGLELDDVTPSELADLLARTGVRHKVIVISACHSGSFIPSLAGPDTVVMAAARADRASFGCSNERDWTYFGDALFNHALRETYSLTEAFDKAKALVGTWEKQQGLKPASEPQISIGVNIGSKLDAISRAREQVPTTMAN